MDNDYDYSERCVVIDNGSKYIKACITYKEDEKFSCLADLHNMNIFKSLVAYPKYKANPGAKQDECFIGDDAFHKGAIAKFNYPIKQGTVSNWDEVEKIWDYTFINKLRVDTCESKILISEPILNAKEEREKSAQIMFETFNVPSLYIANQGVLSLYSTGRVIGVDLESGDGVTQIVPIYEGFYISHAVQRIDIGGKDLTDFMMRLLTEKGRRFSSSSEIEITENIKEKCCYLPSIENENKSIETYIYELPDGTNINIRDERVKCPLALFNPKLLNKEGLGIADACYHCVQKCDIDLRKELYYSVILTGGNTLFPGLRERFEEELKKLVPESLRFDLKISAPEERKYSALIGGAILSLNLKQPDWISKEEYEEYGATVVHRKCF